MGIQSKALRPHSFTANDMVPKPEGIDDLPDLVRYDRMTQVHANMSDHMRSAWSNKALKYLRIYLAENKSKIEACAELGVTSAQYDKMEQELLETEGAKFTSMSTAQRYYLLMLRHELSVRYLEKFIRENFNSDKMIGAIKVKTDILNNMLKIGQDLGIIEKRAKELRVLGDVNLAVLPTEELEELYRERLKYFGEVVGGDSKKLTGPHAKIVQQALSSIEDEIPTDIKIQDVEFEEVVNDR